MNKPFKTNRIGERPTKDLTKPSKAKKGLLSHGYKIKKKFKLDSVRWRKFKAYDWDLKKILLLIFVGGPLFGGFIFFLGIIYFSIGLPDVRDLEQYRVSQSTFIYDRNGKELYAIHGDENRESIEIFDRSNPAFAKGNCRFEEDLCTLSEGYKNIVLATIAIEDDRFFNHSGFDAERLIKAVASQFLPNVSNRGGSTITQQYIKNIFLSPEKRISRKARELILAVKLENVFNKEEILELYLNRIPYGSNAYGIELAAKTYFDKEAKDLTLDEAAILAALPNAPSRYSPYGNYRYAKILKTFTEKELERRDIDSEADLELDEFVRGLLGTVINLNSHVAVEDVAEVSAEIEDEPVEENAETEKPARLTPDNTELGDGTIYIQGRTDLVLRRMNELGFITEDEKDEALEKTWDKTFTRARENIIAPHFVLHIKDLLEDTYGREVVEKGGLKVYTTLDAELQAIAEESVEARKEFNATNFDATNIALVSMSRRTGEVLAMVGSADYFSEEIDGSVNMAMSYVQPGSSFKPFVYALAFAKGLLQPATVLYDVRTQFGGEQHVVENYDGEFLGPLSVRKSLAQSRNVAAVKAYFIAGPQEPIVELTQNMGVDYLDATTEHGSSLALGSAEVSLMSLVEGYTTLANYGIHNSPTMILKVENNEGEVLEEAEINEGESLKVNFAEVVENEEGEEQIIALNNIDALTPEPADELNTTSTDDDRLVLDPQAAYLITDILSDTSVRLGPNMTIPGWQNAAKTGTSNKRFDNGTPENRADDKILPSNTLTVGYTTELVTGVWSGNADGSVLRWNANGYDTAAPIWKSYMVGAHSYLVNEQNITPTYFRYPQGITPVSVGIASGLLPNADSTPSDQVVEELFASYAVPEQVEDMYQSVEIDAPTGKLWNEKCPIENRIEKQMVNHKTLFPGYFGWQNGIDVWAEKEDMLVPKESCEDDYERQFEEDPTLMVLAPFNFAQVPFKPFSVYTFAGSPNGISRVEFYLGSRLQFQDKTAPYIGTIRPPVTASNGDKIEITIKAYDSYGFAKTETIEVRYDDRLDEISEPDNFDEIYENGVKDQRTFTPSDEDLDESADEENSDSTSAEG